jgi:hypothetical protein
MVTIGTYFKVDKVDKDDVFLTLCLGPGFDALVDVKRLPNTS